MSPPSIFQYKFSPQTTALATRLARNAFSRSIPYLANYIERISTVEPSRSIRSPWANWLILILRGYLAERPQDHHLRPFLVSQRKAVDIAAVIRVIATSIRMHLLVPIRVRLLHEKSSSSGGGVRATQIRSRTGIYSMPFSNHA